MTTATAKKLTAAIGLPLLCMFLLLLPAVFVAGCGGSEETTTTVSNATTTTGLVVTSTTSTTEEVTTTTTTDFPPTITQQQDEPRFKYSGKWTKIAASSASGKSIAVANSAGSSLTVRFYGVGVSWLAKTSPAYGHAEVKVDGGAAQTVDLYSAKTVWKKKVWKSTGLALGDHTVTISWTGDKTKGATAANINVDAIVVAGVLTASYEQGYSKFIYEGTWKPSSSSSASGGSFTQADASGASVTIRFSGVRLVWFGRIGAGNGQAKVSVDGGPDATVDLYAATTKAKQALWDTGILDLGTHTVKIAWSGDKNAQATGTSINVDAFEVTGSLK
jgi:hypothetical protein